VRITGLLVLALGSFALVFTQPPAVKGNDESARPITLAPTTTIEATTLDSSSPQPVGDIVGPWYLVFDSEFNGTSLDASQWSTGSWSKETLGLGITTGADWSIEQECRDPAQVSVANGALNLTAVAKEETCGGVTEPYASGLVKTHGLFSFTYGYMEARIWLPGSGSIADWPAFWAVGQKPRTGGEIDVVEGLGGRAVAVFHNSAGSHGRLSGVGTFTGGWHTFAANWEPGSITYYYNGIKIGSVTSGVTSAPMYLVLDLALSSAITTPDTVPATMRVDYVRVWQH
jgi:beta-glucanase (GH16 family)